MVHGMTSSLSGSVLVSFRRRSTPLVCEELGRGGRGERWHPSSQPAEPVLAASRVPTPSKRSHAPVTMKMKDDIMPTPSRYRTPRIPKEQNERTGLFREEAGEAPDRGQLASETRSGNASNLPPSTP